MTSQSLEELVRIGSEPALVEGMLKLPADPLGVVLFAHGSGSSRFSPRNNFVAAELRNAGIGTLLMDLLTPEEDRDYRVRFDISLLTQRLQSATSWLRQYEGTNSLPLGLFGASTGAAAALQVAAVQGDDIAAVVSRGGRPDLAGAKALENVFAPTLLIVGGADSVVIDLNKTALDSLRCEKQLEIVSGASHLFEEAGKLEAVASLATDWFTRYLKQGHGAAYHANQTKGNPLEHPPP